MKKLINTIILLLFPASVLLSCSNLKNYQVTNKEQMKNIHYIPQEFNDVELDIYNHKNYPCTPGYPDDLFKSNVIIINIPKKVIVESTDNVIIPLCGVIAISPKRGLKYDYLSSKTIHVKQIDQDSIYSADIVDPHLKNEYPINPPGYEETSKRRETMVKEAQKYDDKELDEGLVAGNVININILEYVSIPIQSGRYEIYITSYGLESNHAIVEIVEK